MADKELAQEVVVTTMGIDDYLQVTIGTDVRRIKITDAADKLKLYNYTYVGTITTDDLLTPNVDHVFFVPVETGVYPNFGNLEKKANEVAFFRYASGVWYKDTLSEFNHADLGNRNAEGAHESSAIVHDTTNVHDKILELESEDATQKAEYTEKFKDLKVENSFSAEDKTLQNLADPVNDKDGANKRWTIQQASGNGSPKGVAYLTTSPIASPVVGDWYWTAENGDYTNFGVTGATAAGRLIYDGTNWVFVVSDQPYASFPETDPTTVTPPPAGKIFSGAFNGRKWTLQPDGEIRYLKYDDGDWYGVEWDVTVSSPDLKRIGNLDLHRSLPLQSKMYTCLLKDDGTENYKLDPTNWDLQEDGVTASILDGTDGQVKTYLPGHYEKREIEGNWRRLKLSEYPLSGFTYVPPQYVGSYEASLDRTNLKLASVRNLTAQFRGGNNDSSLDGTDKSQLGMPATSISRTNFRTYARARGTNFEMYNYFGERTLFYFFMVEFATRNSQKAVNAALDVNGFRQGGLGAGVTTVSSTDWGNFNSYYPIVPCGASDSLASGTGEVAYTLPATFGDGTVTVMVNRYRGVEMPFGHIYKNADGINVMMAADSEADPTTKAYVTQDNSLWNDANVNGFDLLGEIPRVNGYITQMLPFGIMPLQVGGGSSTYWCDYSYQFNIPASGTELRIVRFGGDAYRGGYAGFGCSNSYNAPSFTSASIGSRLCFIHA